MAVSGGHTPWQMLRALAREEVPWNSVYVAQVDERVAPAGHPDRNLTHLRDSLLEHVPLRPEQICAMPVESPDLEAAAAQYARMLQEIAGSPPVLDLVHLGLGPDGHTASLVPGDPVLERHRRGRRADAALPGKAADDVDLPDAQSCAAHPVGGDGRREGRDAAAPARRRCRQFPPAEFARSMPWCSPTARRPRRCELTGETRAWSVHLKGFPTRLW